MAKPFNLELDHAGLAAELKSIGMQRAIRVKTDQIAAAVRGQSITVGAFEGAGEIPLPVESKVFLTDRAHGLVTIAHPAGEAVQAKYGALTKAAAQAGLKVSDG